MQLKLVVCALMLFVTSLRGATHYVSSAGNNANDGLTPSTPWLTLTYALASARHGCGDTVIIIANGSYLTEPDNVAFPQLPGCTLTNTIQSSLLANFLPIGYRTNPARDNAFYGKIGVAAGEGLRLTGETRGFDQDYNPWCSFTVASSVFTLNCGVGMWNLINGAQIEFEPDISLSLGDFPSVSAPGGLAYLTHYYVVNSDCAMAAGSLCPNGTTFKVSATSGGSAITIGACDANCVNYTNIGMPIAVTVASSTLTTPHAFSLIANNTPVTIVSSGKNLTGAVPGGTAVDTIYYIVNLSGLNFQLAASPGGSPVTLTTVGTGMISVANTNVPNNWAFRGIECKPQAGATIYACLEIGKGGETSILGAVHHVEVDRSYFHGNDTAGENTTVRSIFENGRYVWIHDSYCSGNTGGEAQCLAGQASRGPVAVVNNFMSATGEITIYGGSWPSYPAPNENHLFQGNYYYKPPIWKVTSSTGAASGACLYDNTDPLRTGGEFYTDTMAAQKYVCGSNGMWGTTAATTPTAMTLKNCAEHKNGRAMTYIGNLFNYCLNNQQYMAFNISQESGSGPGIAADHVTLQNNKLVNIYQFASRRSDCGVTYINCLYFPSQHVFLNNLTVTNYLVCGVGFTTGTTTCAGNAQQSDWTTFATAAQMQGESWQHHTNFTLDSQTANLNQLGPTSYPAYPSTGCGGPFPTIQDKQVLINSLLTGDVSGTCGGIGGLVISRYATNVFFSNNALKGGNNAGYGSPGTGNTWTATEYPADNTVVKFVSGDGTLTGDYRLATNSPYSAANMSATRLSTDGTDLGADIDVINCLALGAQNGTPPCDASLSLLVGSAKVVFRYTAPTSSACTTTVYNTLVRNLAGGGNIVGSATADSAATSISDSTRRELLYNGTLTASTHYWYKNVCGTVIMVGDFYTRAAGGTLQFPFQNPSATALTYSLNKDLSSGTTLSAAVTQYVPVATNTVIYSQFSGGQLHVSVAP